MDQRGFAEAFLPTGFGRNARLERIAGLIDCTPIDVLVRRVRPGTTGRPPYRALAMVRAVGSRAGGGAVRRTRTQPTLPHWQSVRNTLIGRVRTAVERTFSELKRGASYGLLRRRYRGLARCGLHLDLAAIAYNLRRAAR